MRLNHVHVGIRDLPGRCRMGGTRVGITSYFSESTNGSFFVRFLHSDIGNESLTTSYDFRVEKYSAEGRAGELVWRGVAGVGRALTAGSRRKRGGTVGWEARNPRPRRVRLGRRT